MLEKERKAVIKGLNKMLSRQNANSYVIKPKPKNKKASERMRLEGNKLFQRKEHDLDAHEYTWQKYTTSISLAPDGSEELASAYANRAALFFHIAKFHDCMTDIDRAIDIVKSDVLKAKWLCRKVKCFHALDDLPNAQKFMREAKRHIDLVEKKNPDASKVLELIEKTEEGLSIKFMIPENVDEPKMPFKKLEAEDYRNVTDQYNAKLGKHLVATRDLAPGEVVYVEKPFLLSMLHFKKVNPFCSHCYAACLTTVPCHSCTSFMFCSERCREEAWKEYHDVECLIYSNYILMGNEEDDDRIQMIIRISIEQCRRHGGMANLKTYLQSINAKKENPSKKLIVNGELKCDKFELLYNEMKKKKDREISKEHIDIVLRTLISLAVNTTFLGRKYTTDQCKHLVGNRDAEFFGSFVLQMIDFTGQAIVMSNVRDSNRRRAGTPNILGASIPAVLMCLLKHSCDPSVSKTYNQANDLTIYAIKPIKMGEKIFYCGGDNYRIMPSPMRQFTLFQEHGFICDCQPCKENWPPLLNTTDDIMMRKPKNYEKTLFKTPLELELYRKHEHIIEKNYMAFYEFDCNEQMLKDLSESVEIALKKLRQPSVITCFLIAATNLVCANLYTHVHPIVDKCS